MGAEPNDGTDNGQRNESLNNIDQRTLKLSERAQPQRCTSGGKKGQATSRSRCQSAKNGANGTDLIKMKFHGS